MSVTILEALISAEMNIENAKKVGIVVLEIAKNQVHNARVLLEKGYSIYDEVDPLLEAHGDVVENVPEKEGPDA